MKYSNQNKPLVSIITSTYNAEYLLEKTLRSVEEQTYPFIEHIVIDGNSTDKTQDIISSHISTINSRISYYTSEDDDGIYDAWNKGLSQIHGDRVCFLGAGDLYFSSHTIERVMENVSAVSEDIPIIYGKIGMFEDEPDAILYYYGASWNSMKNKFYQGSCLPHPAVFHQAKLFTEYGNFDTSFRIAGDYEFLLRVLKEHNARFINIPVVRMAMGGVSTNVSSIVKSADEAYRALKIHGFNCVQGYFKLCVKFRMLMVMEKYFPKFTRTIRKIVWRMKLIYRQ